MRLHGKVAVVTGAGGGFGAGIAARFAAEGASVVVADIDSAAAGRVAAGIGGLAVTCDVADAISVAAMARTALAAHGRIDILVNNAGTTHRNQSLLDVDEATFDRIYAVNVKSLFHTARAIVPAMRVHGGGAIVNIGSTAGLRPRPGLVWYNGTKGAVNTITLSMALELAADRIRVNAVCPVLGGHRADRVLHRGAGHRRDAGPLRRHHPARPDEPARGHRQCVRVPGRGCGVVPDRGVLLPVDGGRTA